MVPLLALALAVLAGGALVLGRLAVVANDAARARTAADAAALAGAAGGRDAAARTAAENAGTLVAWSSGAPGSVPGGVVVVTVVVGGARATAAAERTVACIDARGATVLC